MNEWIIGQPTKTGWHWLKFDENGEYFLGLVRWTSLRDQTLIVKLALDSEPSYKISEIYSYQGPLQAKQ